MKKTVSFSLILPCYNVSRPIQNFLPECDQFLQNIYGKSYEIIAVNDGSSDETLEILYRLQKQFKNLRVLSYSENQGKGYAVKKGVLRSRGELVSYIDSDGEIPASNLRGFIPWVGKGYDVALACKNHPRSKSKFTLKRKIMSQGYRLLVKGLFGLPIKDTQAGLKVFTKKLALEVFPYVRSTGYGFDVEWLSLAFNAGATMKPCPVQIRHAEQNSSVTIPKIMKMIKETFISAIRFRSVCFAKSILPPEKEIRRARFASFL